MQKTDYKDKIFRHRLQIFYRIILCIILVIAATVAIRIVMENRVYTQYEVVSSMKKVGTSDGKFSEYDGGNLLVYSKDGISTYTTDGTQLWNQSYEMQSPLVKCNGPYVAAGDYKGNLLYIMDGKGTTATIETNLPILSLDISAQGVAAVLLQDKDITWLRLFSKKGVLISEVKTTMKNNGYPLSFAVSPDNIKLGVSYVKTEKGKTNTSLAFYNFGGVGQNVTDNLVSGFEYEDQIFPLLLYPDETTALAVGNERLLILKGKQKPSIAKEIGLEQELYAVYNSDTSFALVQRDTEGNGKYVLRIYDLNGKEKTSYTMDFEYTNIVLDQKKVIIYNEARVVVLGMNGVVKYDGELGGSLQALIPTESQSRLIGVFSDEIRLIKLR